MPGEREIEKLTEAVEIRPKPDSSTILVEQDVACGEDVYPSYSMPSMSSSGDATSSSKGGEIDQGPVAEQGYENAYQDQGYLLSQEGLDVPNSGIPMENGSRIYYMPGYNTYAPGQVTTVEGQCPGQQPYILSEGYLQHSVAYMPESVPVYSDSKSIIGDSQNGAKILDDSKPNASAPSSAATLTFTSSKSIKTNGTVHVKASALLSDSGSPLSTSSSDTSQLIKPLCKAPQVSSSRQEAGVAKGYCHTGKFSLSNQGHIGPFPSSSITKSRSNGQTLNGNDSLKMSEKCNFYRSYDASNELVRGPRANRVKSYLSTSAKKDSLNLLTRRDQFNKPDFQVKYEQAKFFMIKSYSEDDIHKSIKYNVWASTTHGNKKLDAAFRDAEKEQKGTKCPIFLFFSVNASGQFVGLAEMIGPVDFKKSMDFWQQDKWMGFFPVKWHIIKDIPNRHFQNIILEDNDNKAVTFSRDSQEIRLPQGLKMLQIFKGYPLGTSILDDFDFYEKREKSLHAIRSNRPAVSRSEELFNNDICSLKHLGSAVRKVEVSTTSRRTTIDPKPSLVTLTKNLSLHTHPPKDRT